MQPEFHGTRQSFGSWLRLAKPIPATFGEEYVMLLDLGPFGALLSGRCDYEQGAQKLLTFAEGPAGVRVRGVVTAVAEHRQPAERDLLVRFQEAGEGLSEFIAGYQEQIRLAQLANAEGDIDHNVIAGDRMLSDLGSAARSNEMFICCRFEGGRWSRETTASREQPPDGFTISAAETEDQVTLLQFAYEESDADERRALREFAAVSLPADQ